MSACTVLANVIISGIPCACDDADDAKKAGSACHADSFCTIIGGGGLCKAPETCTNYKKLAEPCKCENGSEKCTTAQYCNGTECKTFPTANDACVADTASTDDCLCNNAPKDSVCQNSQYCTSTGTCETASCSAGNKNVKDCYCNWVANTKVDVCAKDKYCDTIGTAGKCHTWACPSNQVIVGASCACGDNQASLNVKATEWCKEGKDADKTIDACTTTPQEENKYCSCGENKTTKNTDICKGPAQCIKGKKDDWTLAEGKASETDLSCETKSSVSTYTTMIVVLALTFVMLFN